MTQPPGTGSGPHGPQGQNPYGPTPTPAPPAPAPAFGQQPAPDPYGPPPPQTPAYPPQNPYGSPPPNPYGAPPTPQAPAYGQQPPQNPYGSSPTPPPQAPAFGSAGGPRQYVPGQAPQPGWSGNGPATPPQPGWSGNGSATPPQAYSSPPNGFPPAPPVKKSRTGLIIGVVAAVLVLLVGGGYLLTNVLKNNVAGPIATPSATASSSATRSASTSARPSASKSSATSSASGYPGFKQTGSTLTGPNFTTTMPSGWTLSSSNGGKNEGEIVDKANNIIDYYSDFTRSASANCTYQISSVTTASGIESSDPPVAVDGVTWGGSAATGMKVAIKRDTQTKREVFAFYCLDYNGSGYLIRTIAWETDDASVSTGAKSLLAAWKWQ